MSNYLEKLQSRTDNYPNVAISERYDWKTKKFITIHVDCNE